MRYIVLLSALCSVAFATTGRSPHADLVEKLIRKEGSRYSSNILEDALLDVPGLIAKYGYPIEIHNVITEDGYILEMHRIPHGRDNNNQPGPRTVAFIMHGLYSSSAEFVVIGPNNALAYLLAEAGFDVWLGNARGNHYSEKHLTMDSRNRTNLDFWMFSWDEVGNYDLPAMIDYILEKTGESSVHYLGHSQGGTTFLVLNSLRPEYNEKFKSFHGLAPASFFIDNEHALFNLLAPYNKEIEALAFRLGIPSIFTNRDLFTWLGVNCADDDFLQPLCARLLFSEDSIYRRNLTMIPIYLGHAPAGASLRQLVHFGQSIHKHTFSRFDHGPMTNIHLYGNDIPPPYDLHKITVPAYLHYGLADVEVNYKDVYRLSEHLPNVVGVFRVPRDTFSHIDFVWGDDVKELLYDRLVELLVNDVAGLRAANLFIYFICLFIYLILK